MTMNEGHRRSLTTSTVKIDQFLHEFEIWARGVAAQGPCYREQNTIPPGLAGCLSRQIEAVRETLRTLQQEAGLEPVTRDVMHNMRTTASVLIQYALSMQSQRLKGYGPMERGDAARLDERVDELEARLRQLARMLAAPPEPE